MKVLLFIATVSLGLSACNMADDEDYKAMAKDMCGCVNEHTEGLSDEGRKVLEEAGENDTDIEAALMEFGQDNPMQMMQDNQVLSSLKGPDFLKCVTELQKKYDDLYTSGSADESQKKMLEVMKKMDNCKLTYTFVKAGMAMN